MKTKTILMAALVCLAFMSCKKDENKVTATAKYEVLVGLGIQNHTDTEASPALVTLLNLAQGEVNQLNATPVSISVTGNGKDEAAAKADAEQKAIAEFTAKAKPYLDGIAAIETSFIAKRKELAEDIKTIDQKYFVKLELALMMRVDNSQPAVKELGLTELEAVGGEDYSK